MQFKILTILLIITNASTYCSDVPQKSYNFLKVPNNVDTIDMTPHKDGMQIKFFNQHGEPIIPDASWNTKVYTSDQRIIKHLSQNTQNGEKQNEINFRVVNNNEHVITQNNFQKQEWPIPPRHTIDYDKIPQKPGILSLTASLITSNQGLIVLGSVSLCWLGLMSKLIYSSYTISTQRGWGVWNSHLSMEVLYHSNQIELAQSLFNDIQKAYAEKKNSFLTPLVYFINETDAELSQLKSFLRLHEILGTIKIAALFPKQLEVKEMAFERINRLQFLKNLVNTYATEYKVAN
jgi:hypothetical protein